MILSPGTTYTFKVDSAEFFQFTGADAIRETATWLIDGVGSIHSIERLSASNYYMVRLDVSKRTDAETVSGIIRTAFQQSGYEQADVIEVLEGTKSSSLLREVVKEGAEGTAPLTKPVADFLLKVVGILLVAVALGGALYMTVGGKKDG